MLIRKGKTPGTIIPIDNIGFTNGCIDLVYQTKAYAELAYSNVYDFQVINKTVYEYLLDVWSKPNGCRDKLLQCRALEEVSDPNEFAINKTVTSACDDAQSTCEDFLLAYSDPAYTIHPPVSRTGTFLQVTVTDAPRPCSEAHSTCRTSCRMVIHQVM